LISRDVGSRLAGSSSARVTVMLIFPPRNEGFRSYFGLTAA
jgi:hypothetical protein